MCTAMEIFKKKTENIGYEKGEVSGIKKDRIMIINNMYNNGLTIDEISKYTNLNQEEVTQYLSV